MLFGYSGKKHKTKRNCRRQKVKQMAVLVGDKAGLHLSQPGEQLPTWFNPFVDAG